MNLIFSLFLFFFSSTLFSPLSKDEWGTELFCKNLAKSKEQGGLQLHRSLWGTVIKSIQKCTKAVGEILEKKGFVLENVKDRDGNNGKHLSAFGTYQVGHDDKLIKKPVNTALVSNSHKNLRESSINREDSSELHDRYESNVEEEIIL